MNPKIIFLLLIAVAILYSKKRMATNILSNESTLMRALPTHRVNNYTNNFVYAFNESEAGIRKVKSQTEEVFAKLITYADAGNWRELPIGELIGELGILLIGTKYEANTLEAEGPEICRIRLDGLDCVTFFENILCLARNIKKNRMTLKEFYDEVTYTRYRSGVLDDYTSRLHYTADWIYDNIQKGIISDMTQNIGGEKFNVNVFFMSRNPDYYKQLKEHPEFTVKMADIEREINEREYYYIPKTKISAIEKELKTGDIIAIATKKQGLDYSHTGIIIRDKSGKARFLHASSKKKAVVMDEAISNYLMAKESDIGITVLRPVEVE